MTEERAPDERAQRTQQDANEIGMNEDDERAAKERRDKTGDPYATRGQ